MTQDEIIEMANDMAFMACIWIEDDSNEFKDMIAFAKLVAAKEREACAKLVEVSDDLADWEIICGSDGRVLLNEMAKAIRARGEQHCCDKP